MTASILAPIAILTAPMLALFIVLLAHCLHPFSCRKSGAYTTACTSTSFDCTCACTFCHSDCTLPSPVFLPEIRCFYHALTDFLTIPALSHFRFPENAAHQPLVIIFVFPRRRNILYQITQRPVFFHQLCRCFSPVAVII